MLIVLATHVEDCAYNVTWYERINLDRAKALAKNFRNLRTLY
jgi:hypothetical protein